MCRLALVGLLCIACDGTHREELTDTGTLCLLAREDELEVLVAFRTCLSSSCDRLVSESCSVERTGNELRVSSRAVWETGFENDCTADCVIPVARCVLPGVEAGSYTVLHGSESAIVSLPTSGEQLFGDAAPICADAPTMP